jgi:hypothetical protein
MAILLPTPESCLAWYRLESRDFLVLASGTNGPHPVLDLAAVRAPARPGPRPLSCSPTPGLGLGPRICFRSSRSPLSVAGIRVTQVHPDDRQQESDGICSAIVGRYGGRRMMPEAGSYCAIAVRCWPAFGAVGCTGGGREYRRSSGPLNPPEYGEEDGMTTVAENRPGGRIMTAEPGSWWLVVLGGLTGQAARVAEADRERAALLATVSHDLRPARRSQDGGQRPSRRLRPADHRRPRGLTSRKRLPRATGRRSG